MLSVLVHSGSVDLKYKHFPSLIIILCFKTLSCAFCFIALSLINGSKVFPVDGEVVLSCCDAEQKKKTEPFDLEEVVQEMPREQRHALWGKLASLLQDVLQDLPPEQWDRGGEEGMDVEAAGNPVSLSNDACMFRFYSSNIPLHIFLPEKCRSYCGWSDTRGSSFFKGPARWRCLQCPPPGCSQASWLVS